MKVLGVLGGIGPESTIAYYRALIAEGRAATPDGEQPPILINSIDVQRVLALVEQNAHAELVDYVVRELTYFENHAHLMRYARLRKVGLPVGSGVTEGACQSVIEMRTNGGGQRGGLRDSRPS